MGHAWLVAQQRCRRRLITSDSGRSIVCRNSHVLVFIIAICTSLGHMLCVHGFLEHFESYGPTKTSPWSNIPPLLHPKAIHPNTCFLVLFHVQH